MTTAESLAGQLDDPAIGDDIHRLAAELFPICRSITGPGLRETLARLRRLVPLEIHAVASGTQVLDWTVPKEWTIHDAWVKNAAGERVIDFRAHNLHVMSYSVPVRAVMSLEELKKHIFTLPGQPDLIPYRTSYYAENWGFCLSHRAMEALPDGEYEVVIDSEFTDGALNYGELIHRGETDQEVLLSTPICHPSLANDNCSGMAVLTHLAARLSQRRTRYTYRFLWAPATIGAIAWLAEHEADTRRIRHGLVISCVGDAGGPTYKRTRRGDALIDRAMAHLVGSAGGGAKIIDFFPYGYDERQFNSPGFQLDIGLFQRSQFATFPEYHTSADDLTFIRPEHLAASYRTIAAAIDIIENDRRYLNTLPKAEPQLGKRGLYSAIGGDAGAYDGRMAMLWLLNLSDGGNSLLDVAERANLPFRAVADTARILVDHGLLVPAAELNPSSPGWN